MMGARLPSVKVQPLITVSMGLLALCVAWIMGGWISAGNRSALIFWTLAVVVSFILLQILRDWRSGIYLFFIWLLFEDLVRKYMGNNMYIYFGKDVLVVCVYFSYLMSVRHGKDSRFRPPFLVPLALFVWLGVMQCFNPSSPSLLYSLLGFKLYFFYIPLMFVGYALLRTEEDLERFLVINLALAGVIAVLGIIQGLRGPEFLNPRVLAPEIIELSTQQRFAPISGAKVFRPNSVFVSDGRFASYMMLAWLLGMGTAGFLLLRRSRFQKYVYPVLGIVLVAIALSGSRGAFMFTLGNTLVVGAALLWGVPWKWRWGRQLVKVVRRTFLLGGLSVVLAIAVFPQALGARWAFYAETLSPTSRYSELGSRTWDYPLANMMVAFADPRWVYGHGIGTASLGVQYVSKWLGQRPPKFGVESGFGALVLELGIMGLVLWLVWAVAAVRSCWGAVLRLRQSRFFPVAFSIFWFAGLLLLPMTFTGIQAYQNYIFNAYLWLLMGILFRLPSLAAQQPLYPVAPARTAHGR